MPRRAIGTEHASAMQSGAVLGHMGMVRVSDPGDQRRAATVDGGQSPG